MALQAILQIDNKEFDVMSFDYELSTSYSNTYKTSTTAPQGGMINFTILTPLIETNIFHEWLLDTKMKKEGTFILPLTHGTVKIERLFMFAKAHCIYIHESYNNSDSSQMYMRITIIASIIKFGNGSIFLQSGLKL